MILLGIVMFLLGVFAGVLCTEQCYKKSNPIVGVFRVNAANPEKDIFKLEFTSDPFEMPNHKMVRFEVVGEKNAQHNE